MMAVGGRNTGTSGSRVAGVVSLVLAGMIVAAPGNVRALPDAVSFTLVDENRSPAIGASISFCPPDTACADILLEPGAKRFLVAVDALVPEQVYRVVYRPAETDSTHVLERWVYAPQEWAAEIDPYLGIPREIVSPTFVVSPTGALEFRVDRAPNHIWERAHRSLAATTSGAEAPPRWLFGFGSPLMLGGNFASDPGALLGIESVAAGVALSVSWRPSDDAGERIEASTWHRYRELTVSYAANRYDMWLALNPDQLGDVTFHRINLSGGFGTMRGGAGIDLGAGGQLSFGGIYDGASLLEFESRSYRLFGLGIYLRAAYTFLLGDVALGPTLRFEYLHFPADHGSDDFWYGGMPALTLGVTLH